MRSIDSDTPISKIGIVGTHNSAASSASFKSRSVCQSLSIGEQLAAGVRMLDLRLFYGRRGARAVHSVSDCYSGRGFLYFDEILFECRRFLAENSGEFLVMSVKPERVGSKSARVKFFSRFYKEYVAGNDIWYACPSIPALGECRGKIVLMRRCECDGNLKERGGLDFSVWRDCAGRSEYKPFVTPINSYQCAEIQDCYALPREKKLHAALSFAYSGAPDENTVRINFLSTANAPSLKKTATYINDAFSRAMPEAELPSCWTLIDFADAKICSRLNAAQGGE